MMLQVIADGSWITSIVGVEVIPLAAISMVIVIALTYMFSKLLNSSELAAYVNVELYQLFVSMILVISIVAIWNVVYNTSMALADNKDPIEYSVDFLKELAYRGLIPLYTKVFGMNFAYNFLNAVEQSWLFGSFGGSWKQYPGYDLLPDVLAVLMFGIFVLIGTISAQIILLYLIKAVAVYILAAGIVVRFFPPTREAGVFLIVFAIGFGIVFPLFYVLQDISLNDAWSLSGYGEEYMPEVDLGTGVYTLFPIGIPFRMSFGLGAIVQVISYIAIVGLFIPSFSSLMTIAFITGTSKFILGRI